MWTQVFCLTRDIQSGRKHNNSFNTLSRATIVYSASTFSISISSNEKISSIWFVFFADVLWFPSLEVAYLFEYENHHQNRSSYLILLSQLSCLYLTNFVALERSRAVDIVKNAFCNWENLESFIFYIQISFRMWAYGRYQLVQTFDQAGTKENNGSQA